MGGRCGAGGVTQAVPTSERIRVKYTDYLNIYYNESKKVYDSYDKATKTIELDINPRIYEIEKMIPDDFVKKWADNNYDGGLSELSQYGNGYRATCAKDIYKAATSELQRRRLQRGDWGYALSSTKRLVLQERTAVSEREEKWMKKAINMAVYGKK